jgi:hypothetical protein
LSNATTESNAGDASSTRHTANTGIEALASVSGTTAISGHWVTSHAAGTNAAPHPSDTWFSLVMKCALCSPAFGSKPLARQRSSTWL